MTELNRTMLELREKDQAFFREAFTNPITRKPYPVPQDIKQAATDIVRSYGIRGICDPMYIANVIARCTGRGDGQSHFNTTAEQSANPASV